MYQQILISLLYFNLHQSWKIPIPPDDGSNRPPMLHLIHDSYSEKLCEFFATDDLLRCQLVLFNWYWIRKDFSVYQFRFGKLTFYAHRWRMYRTDDYDLVEYMLQIRWRITGRIYNETKEFIDQNKMVLFYVRPENTLGENADIGYTDFGHGRGWFSFIFEGEYYSFNLYNLVDANATLLLQKKDLESFDNSYRFTLFPAGRSEGLELWWVDRCDTYGHFKKIKNKFFRVIFFGKWPFFVLILI